MTIKELCEKAFSMAREKGWYSPAKTSLECYALVHSEISEAVEAARVPAPPIYYEIAQEGGLIRRAPTPELTGQKPEGELVELADAVIRIADYCGARGWDLEQAIKLKMAYNATRPHRHGGKLY